MFWALSAVMDFFYTTKFLKLSLLSFEAEEGEQQPILVGLFVLTKTNSFRPAHKIYYSFSPLLQLEMKTDSISRTL